MAESSNRTGGPKQTRRGAGMNIFVALLTAGWTIVSPSFGGEVPSHRIVVDLCEAKLGVEIPVTLGCPLRGLHCNEREPLKLSVEFKDHPVVKGAKLSFQGVSGVNFSTADSTSATKDPTDKFFNLESGNPVITGPSLDHSKPAPYALFEPKFEPEFKFPFDGRRQVVEFAVLFEQYLGSASIPVNMMEARLHFEPCRKTPQVSRDARTPGPTQDRILLKNLKNPSGPLRVVVLQDYYSAEDPKKRVNDITTLATEASWTVENLQRTTQLAVLSEGRGFWEWNRNPPAKPGLCLKVLRWATYPVRRLIRSFSGATKIRLKNPIVVNVNFWIDPNNSDEKNKAERLVQAAHVVFEGSRVGVFLKRKLRHLPEGSAKPSDCPKFGSKLPPFPHDAYEKRQLNVHFWSSRGGFSCSENRNMIFVSPNNHSDDQLAHEIGHAFALNPYSCETYDSAACRPHLIGLLSPA